MKYGDQSDLLYRIDDGRLKPSRSLADHDSFLLWARQNPSLAFFQLIKRERIKKKIYPTRDAGRQDVFNYIELFYNTVRRHGNNEDLSPVEFENRYFMKLQSV